MRKLGKVVAIIEVIWAFTVLVVLGVVVKISKVVCVKF